jgi:hypothetical protein
MINIIIRTSYRPNSFKRLLDSIHSQTYEKINLIIGYDNNAALEYIPNNLPKHKVSADRNFPYYYDLYINELKAKIETGWFVAIDDDDILASPTVLEKLAAHLTEPSAIICQMLRNGIAKPRDNYIKNKIIAEGKIGLPCLVLHSRYKSLSGLDGQKAGDYRYIKDVTDQVPTKFINLPLVNAGARGHGKMETNIQVSNISE